MLFNASILKKNQFIYILYLSLNIKKSRPNWLLTKIEKKKFNIIIANIE